MEGATGSAPGGPAPLGGRFDFDDGGTYLGGWEDGKAHGHGVCTGPKGQGAYSGSWHYGFEVSGVYTWPSGSAYEGQWQNGKRHGLGLEARGRWLYRGEWTQGFKGRYGVRQSATTAARYEGTWANGLQDGYGSETYADGGTYQGQWLRGMRHGYGVRASAPFGLASHPRATSAVASPEGGPPEAERDRRLDDSRGGFVLKAKSNEAPPRRGSLIEKSTKKGIFGGLRMIRKPRSTGDLEKKGTSGGSIRSTGSSASWVSTESSQSGVTSGSLHTDSNASFVVEDEQLDPAATETYMGEWKNDKRSGFGISERSDGLRYEGEWFNNKKYGYGVTTFRDGSREEGKYKNNLLITSQKKRHLFLIRSSKFRERIDAAVNAAQRASKIALQKADIAISRTATARGKAEVADMAADQAREDFEIAKNTALKFAPDFTLPGLDKVRSREVKPRTETDRAPQVNSSDSLPPTPASQANRYQANYQQSNYQQSNYQPSNYQQSNYQQTNYQQSNYQQPNYPQTNYQAQTNYQPPQGYQPYPYGQDGYDHNSVRPATPSRSTDENNPANPSVNRTTVRRVSKQIPADSPPYNFQQAMSDHFDQYKRPPSRDSSVDRYSRAASRLGGVSRQPSVEKSDERAGSTGRGSTPAPQVRGSTPGPQTRGGTPGPQTRGGTPGPQPRGGTPGPQPRGGTPGPQRAAGNGAAVGAGAGPFEEVLLRRRGLGQDILPSPVQPKRTESLYVSPQAKEPHRPVPVNAKLERKKSLPEVAVEALPSAAMSREEVSVLSSARREEVRRRQLEQEKYRANPLLYLCSPQVKEWFSRQQLVMFVLFVNISLAIMFFKLLT